MEFCEREKCGIYNLAYDTQPADDAIIYVNNDSPVLTSVKICCLTSVHQTLKPRIRYASGIRLIRLILSLAQPHLPFTGQSGLKYTSTTRWQQRPNDSCFWMIRFRVLLLLRQTDMLNRHWRERLIDDCHVGLHAAVGFCRYCQWLYVMLVKTELYLTCKLCA